MCARLTRTMAAPGFTIVYAFNYRGAVEEWSQRYHLDSDFTNVADFHATIDAFVTAVKPAIYSSVTCIRAYGYHDTDDDAFATYDFPDVAGTFAPAVNDTLCPGDAAAWVRWNTERHNSRGRLIYLRKYFHGVFNHVGAVDALVAGQKTALETFAAAATGTGWNGHHLAGPDGLVPGGGSSASPYITTRTLNRR